MRRKLKIVSPRIDECRRRGPAGLLGVLSSMPCDWQSRRTVELHMTFEQFGLLSIPDPGEGHPVRDRVVEIAGRLSA